MAYWHPYQESFRITDPNLMPCLPHCSHVKVAAHTLVSVVIYPLPVWVDSHNTPAMQQTEPSECLPDVSFVASATTFSGRGGGM